MPRPKAMLPKYEFHVSGQARVRFCGKDYYLGKFGTPESYAKYHALVGEFLQNGKQPPAAPNSSGGDKEHLGEQPIRIRDVTADFRYRVLPRYDSDQGQYNRFSNLCDLLDKRHGSESPDATGGDMAPIFFLVGTNGWGHGTNLFLGAMSPGESCEIGYGFCVYFYAPPALMSLTQPISTCLIAHHRFPAKSTLPVLLRLRRMILSNVACFSENSLSEISLWVGSLVVMSLIPPSFKSSTS